jgi:hypothetical protein
MTRSIFVICWTGRSAGFSPLWKEHTHRLFGTSHYDPAVAHPDENGYIVPKHPEASHPPPEKAEPGLIYRGMSHEEYQHALKRGSFESTGEHNIGDKQKGLTYFSSDPHQAKTYSHSFAPWYHGATPHHPAVVVAVKDRKNYEVDPRYPTELGVRGSTPTSDIHHVYFGKPYHVKPGHVDINVDHTGPSEGSRDTPSAHLMWHREDMHSGTHESLYRHTRRD